MTGSGEARPRPAGAPIAGLALRAGAVLTLCALAFYTPAMAQGGGWAAVDGISPGSRVEVRLSTHGTAKGTLASVSSSGIDIERPNGSIRRIARARIAKVYLVGKSHKLRDSLIGTGVGFAGGFAVHFAATREYESPGGPLVKNPRVRQSVEFGAFCAAIGTAVGAAIGLRRSKTLVYQRESDRKTHPNERGRASPAGLTRVAQE